MRQLRSSIRHVVTWARSARRLIGPVVLSLALGAGLPTGRADEPPAPVRKGGEPARGTTTEPAGARPSRPKPPKTSGVATKPKPSPVTPPGKTPPRPTPEGDKNPPPEGAGSAGTGPEGEPLESGIDATYEQMLKPAEERRYSISIQEGSYADLLDAFSRMSGLAILGDTPAGTVTYVSTEEMDYTAALSRMRKILFNHPEKFYLWREGNTLEVFRVTEAQRKMKPDRIHTSVHAFLAAELDEMEIVLVLYTPETGRVADLESLRDFMPDYVRIAPYRDKNALTILALARDVKKYLELVGIFETAEGDPRQLKALPIRYVLPSEAVEMLYQFMPALAESVSAPSAPPPKPRKGQHPAEASLESARGHGIDLIPYDAVRKLFVRGMPDRIAEIENYLEIIDVQRGPGDNPVIVPLKYTRVEQLLTLLRPFYTGEPAAQAPQPPAGGKGKRAPVVKAVTNESIITDTIEIYANPANNTLIVMADEEQLTKLRMYVSLLDIPSQDQTVRVKLEHAEPEAVAALTVEIAPILGPNTAVGLLVKVDPAGDGVLVIGNPQGVELAKRIIADLDQPGEGGPPAIHAYPCENAKPSALIGLLTNLDQQSAGAAPAAPPQPPGPAKKGQPRAARRPVQGGTRYYGDDATGLLYVICTDSEWEESYLPLLKKLDQQAQTDLKVVVVPVAHGDPQKIIESLVQALSGGQRGAAIPPPTMLPHPEGVMVVGASAAVVEQIRKLVAELDVDPGIERRTFTLQYADPAEVKTVLDALVVQGAGPRITPRRGGKGQPAPPPAPGAPSVQIVQSGRNLLIVVAPAQEMAEIAALITELDVDPLNLRVKVYDFPVGSNVLEIAQTLSSFYPGSAAVPVAEATEKGKPRPRQMTAPGDIRFIPQPSAHKILVSAPADMYPDIEEKIALLRPEAGIAGPMVEFFEVAHLDPQTLTGVLEPLLETKYQELVDTGVIPEKPPGKGPAAKPVSVTPDPRGDRVIVVAPVQMMEPVRKLIERLDRPDRARVMKTVTLEKADPKEMVTTVRALLSSRGALPAAPTTAPARPGGQPPGRGRAAPPQRPQAGETETVTVVEAPGGSAILLSGYEDDVARVEQWIKDLDEAAKSGRDIKIYAPKNVAVEDFADAVMTLVDSGGGAAAAPPKPKGGKEGESLFDMDLFSKGGPRRGKDIYLVTDTWARTMLVSAMPSKIREIDRLYEVYEGKEGEEPQMPVSKPQPYEIYTLKNRKSAYDAVWDLESYIDKLWPDPSNKPKVDYIPFTPDLIIRCRPEDMQGVKDLIEKYVDKPGEKTTLEERTAYEVIQSQGITARDLARLVQSRVGPDKVHLQEISAADQDYIKKVEEITPCVLPVCAVQGMRAVACGMADEPAKSTTQPADLNSPAFNEQMKMKQDLLRSLSDKTASGGEAATSQPAGAEVGPGTPAGQPAPATEAAGPEQVLTIAPDDEKGVVVIKGTKQEVAELKDVIEKIVEELQKVPQPPDIRVFRVKFVDVNTAADILEAMFNAPRQRNLTPQQIQQMQQLQMLQQQQQQQRQQRQPQQPPQAGQEEDKGKGKQRKEGEEAQQPQTPQQEPGQIRVYPDARTHTLIIRASPEQYPPIIKLLATVDKKGTAADFRIYALKRLNAAEVEQKLKEMLGLEGRSARASQPRPTTPGGRPGVPVQNPQGQPIEFMMDMGGESLSLTGAERVTISSNPATNTIMAMAPEKTLDLIGQLIDQLEEQEVPLWVTKTYELKHADAADVAAQLEKTFSGKSQGKGVEGYDPSDVNRPTFIPDARMNSITVRVLELDLPKIEPLIEQFDRESRDDKPRYIKLQYAKPSEVAKKLQEAFAGVGAGKGGKKSKIQITGDDGSMQLIVIAPPDTFADLQDMVAKLDVERTNLEFRTFSLTYARAPEVLRQMTELVRVLIQTGQKSGVDLGVFSAVADEPTNALVVAGEPTIFPIVEGVLKKIDVPPPEPVALETRIYRLVSAQAEDVANTINRLFGQVRGKGGAEPARAEPNPSTNTVLVRGTKSQQEEIFNQVIKPLDEFAEQPINLKQAVIDLQYAKADEVANYLNEWFRNQQQTIRGAGIKGINPLDFTVSITPEVASNKLLVTANDKNLELIRQRVADVDRKEFGDLTARVTMPYALMNADPNAVAQIVSRHFQPTGGKIAERDRVDAAPEVATMRVVVTASQQNQEKIAALIEQLDKDSVVTRPTHVVELHNSDAAAAARALQEMFVQGRAGPRGQQTVSISNPQGSNSLLIRANEKELAEIQAVITQMEATGTAGGGEIKIIPLKYTDAEETRVILEEYLRKPGARGGGRGGGGGAELVGDLRISVSTQNNSLILSGNAEQLAQVTEVVARIDVEVEGAGNVPKIIRLEHAQASAIQPQLEELFKQQPGRRSPGGGGAALQPVIVADDASNSLIVRANPADFNAIERLVKDLDSEGAAGAGIRIVRVAPGVNVVDMAAMLEDSFNASLKSQPGGGGRGRPVQQLTITPDTRTNSLILAGAPAMFDDIEATIRTLEKMGPQGGQVTRIIRTKNADARDVESVIRDLTGDNTGTKSSGRGGGSRGSRPPRK